MRRGTLVVLASSAMAATTAPALAAPTITTDRRCYAIGQRVQVAGAGFGPNETIAFSGAVDGPRVADASGSFSGTFGAPSIRGSGPGTQTFRLTAQAPSGTTSTTFRVARVGADFTPNQARARSRVRWKLAGFPTGRTVYAHYVLGGKRRVTVRFGRPTGSCGELRKRVRLIPTRARSGTWTVQLDNRRRYSKRSGWLVRKRILVFLRPVTGR